MDKSSVVLLVERLEKCIQNKTYSRTHSSYPTKRASHCNVQNCMPFCCGKIDIICSWVPFLSNNKTTRIWLFKPHEVCCCLFFSNRRYLYYVHMVQLYVFIIVKVIHLEVGWKLLKTNLIGKWKYLECRRWMMRTIPPS